MNPFLKRETIISGFTKKKKKKNNNNSLPPLDPFRIFSCFILFVKILPTLIFSSCTLVFLKFIIQEYRDLENPYYHIYIALFIYLYI
jgi:hypothetical protein